MNYTTSCNTQSSAPEDGQNNCPKYVELIGIINKLLLLHVDKSDLEVKLQTYNKINGAIRWHFGKQMNKETKLRIHNITAKVALKFGSEACTEKKRGTIFRSNTDEIFETLTGNNKTR